MDWQEIWKLLNDNAGPVGAIAALLAILGTVIGVVFWMYRLFFTKRQTDVEAIVQKLRETAHQEGALSTQLDDAHERIGDLEDQNRQLTAAIEALKAEGAKPDAPPAIDQALKLLSEGDTAAAEAVFEEVKARRKAEGEGALKEAAAAARHIGALAFLHATDKALAAYREAVALDPDDPDGWNQLGHLLDRTGNLDGAMEAYNRVLSLGNWTTDQGMIAAATGNLGNLYMTRGDHERAEEMYRKSLELHEALGREEGIAAATGNLGVLYAIRGELDRAEEMYRKSLKIEEALGHQEGMANAYGGLGILYATRGEFDPAEKMYRKSLEIDEALGRKEGMAKQYGNLGNLYQTRGDLDRAEEMYEKGLEIDEALGRKEGMARKYGNLGTLYRTRGDLDRAEEMYRKSLELFREIGATAQIEKMEGLLAELREAG